MAVLVTDNDPYSGQWRAAESRANIDARLDKLLQVAGLDHNVLSDTRKRETIYHFAEAYDEAIKSIRKSRKKSVLAERSAQTIPDSEAAFRPTVKPKPAGLKHRAPPPIPNSSSTIPKPLPPLPTVSSGHVRAEETDSEISLHYLRRQRDQIFQNSGFSSSNPGNGNHYLYDSKSKRAAQYWQQSDVENSETQPGSVSLPTTIPSFAKDLSDSVNQRAPQVESLARRQIVTRDPPPAVYPKPKRNVTRRGIPTELTIARSFAPRYSPPTRDLKHAPLVQAPYPDRLSLILKQILDEETYASISKPTDEVFTCDKPIPTKPFDPVQPSNDTSLQPVSAASSQHQTPTLLNAKLTGLFETAAFDSNTPTCQSSKIGPFDGNVTTEPRDNSYQQDTSAKSQHNTLNFLNAKPTGLFMASAFSSNTKTFQNSKTGPFDGNVTTEPSDNPCQQDTSKTSHHQAQHFLNAKPNGLYVAPAFISNSQTSPNSRTDPTPTGNSFQQVVTESSQTQSPHLIKDKTTRPHAAAHPDPKPQTCQKTKPSPKAPKDIPKIRTQPSTSVITALTDPATPPFLNANTNWSSRIAVIDPTTPPFLNSKPVLHIPFYPLEKSNHFVYDTQPDQFIGAASPAVHLDKLEPQISVLPNHISPVPNATTNPTSSPATLPKIFPPISLSTSDITQHDPITTNDPTSSLATPPESFSPISLSTSDPNPHVPISTTDPPLALLPKRFSHVSLSTSDPNPHVPISTTDPPPALPPKRSSPNPLASISPAFYPSLPPKKYLHTSMSTLNQTSSSENFNKPNSVTSGKKKAKDGHYSIPGPPIPVSSKTAKSVPVNHYKPLPPLHAASAKSICHYAIPGPPIPVSNYIPTNSLLHNGNPVTLNHVARIKPSLRANHTDQCAKQSLLDSGAAPAPSRDLHGETEAHKPMAFPLRKDVPPNDAKLAQTAAARIEAAASVEAAARVEAAIHADAATHHKEATHVESAIHVKAAANVQAAQHRCALPPRPKPPLRAALLDRSRYPKRNHYYKTVFAVTYAYMVVLRMARF